MLRVLILVTLFHLATVSICISVYEIVLCSLILPFLGRAARVNIGRLAENDMAIVFRTLRKIARNEVYMQLLLFLPMTYHFRGLSRMVQAMISVRTDEPRETTTYL